MGLTRKVKRNLDNSSGLPPELQDSINSLFDDFYGKEVDDDEEDDGKSPPIPPKKKPVDFSEIFGQAEGIVEKREAGFTTKDGFILLKRRPGVKI